jgi:hypothetical protein
MNKKQRKKGRGAMETIRKGGREGNGLRRHNDPMTQLAMSWRDEIAGKRAFAQLGLAGCAEIWDRPEIRTVVVLMISQLPAVLAQFELPTIQMNKHLGRRLLLAVLTLKGPTLGKWL